MQHAIQQHTVQHNMQQQTMQQQTKQRSEKHTKHQKIKKKNDPLNQAGRVGLNYSNLIRGLLTEHASNETKVLTEDAREMFHDHPDTYRNNTVHCNHFFLSHLG